MHGIVNKQGLAQCYCNEGYRETEREGEGGEDHCVISLNFYSNRRSTSTVPLLSTSTNICISFATLLQ